MNSAGDVSGTNRQSSTCTPGCHKHSVQTSDFGLGTSVSLTLLAGQVHIWSKIKNQVSWEIDTKPGTFCVGQGQSELHFFMGLQVLGIQDFYLTLGTGYQNSDVIE